MALLTEFQRSQIKKVREMTYDTDISVISVTSNPNSGDAYGKTTSKTSTTTIIKADVSYGRQYGFRSAEAGLIEEGDMIVTCSLDYKSLITANKTRIEVGGMKYSIGQVEIYSNANEMIIRCNRIG